MVMDLHIGYVRFFSVRVMSILGGSLYDYAQDGLGGNGGIQKPAPMIQLNMVS